LIAVAASDNGLGRWRHASSLPPVSVRIDSAYDIDARYCIKRSTEWVGYKVHITEVCSPDVPHLIINADTTTAQAPDAAHAAGGQNELAGRKLLPKRQLVDGSYRGSQIVLDSRKNHGIELVGP
jgi:transposase